MYEILSIWHIHDGTVATHTQSLVYVHTVMASMMVRVWNIHHTQPVSHSGDGNGGMGMDDMGMGGMKDGMGMDVGNGNAGMGTPASVCVCVCDGDG
ncbi:hypothetical protein EON64_03950 [archaeon]|nr:MAG: hypothetical protein EON64_03950 [archaeon]